MKKFDRTRLWTLIFDPVALGNLTQPDANAVLNDFAEELHDYCRRETKIAERTRTLNYARSDLRIQLESFRSGAGKKCGHPKTPQTGY